jgi:predicted dehydrogenase
MTVGVALLGAGFMGTQHAKAYRRLTEAAAVRVVCSRSGERAARLAEELGADSVISLEAALDRQDVDVVDICLPTDLHASVAIMALETGHHVLVQKPIALSLEDADAMGQTADKAGCMLMVAMTLRFWPEYEALERLVAGDRLGQVTGLVAERLSPPTSWNVWMSKSARSGGVPVDLMIHDLDLVSRYLGRPLSVLASSPSKKEAEMRSVFALVECERGVASVAGSTAMPPSFPFSSLIRLMGSAGAAEFRYRDVGGVEGGNVSKAAAPSLVEVWREGEQEQLKISADSDPWEREVAYFVRCVVTGQKPRIGVWQEARQTLELALAVRRSACSGQREVMGDL